MKRITAKKLLEEADKGVSLHEGAMASVLCLEKLDSIDKTLKKIYRDMKKW